MKKIVLVVLVLLIASTSYADEITVQMKDATLSEIVTAIAAKGKVAVILDKNANKNLRIPLIDFRSEPTEHALLILTSAAGLAMTYTVVRNSNSPFGIPTYFLSNLSIASRQQMSLETAPPPFQYKYPSGSSVLLQNVNIAKLLLVIATSCNVGIISTQNVDQSEIIQQITISQMTPEVAFAALTKATGLTVIKIQKDRYLVATSAADADKGPNQLQPSIPPNPQGHLWRYFIEPLSSR